MSEQHDIFGGATSSAFMQRNGLDEVKAVVMNFSSHNYVSVLHIAKSDVCFRKTRSIQEACQVHVNEGMHLLDRMLHHTPYRRLPQRQQLFETMGIRSAGERWDEPVDEKGAAVEVTSEEMVTKLTE